MRLKIIFFDETSVSETSGLHVHGVQNRSGTNARETIGCCHAFSPLRPWIANLRTLCTRGETKCQKGAKIRLSCRYRLPKNIQFFFKNRGDRQMTEIFVTGTEVFSDAKMTETPYE